MRTQISLILAALASTSALAQTAAPLPANVQADRNIVLQNKAALKTAFTQLSQDKQAGNSAALAADRTAVRLARMQMAASLGALQLDAATYLQADRDNLFNAINQLHNDQVAANAAAITADQATIAAAEKQLRADRHAVFEGLGNGHRGHGKSRGA